MKNDVKYFVASCFQSTDGSYLSIFENERSLVKMRAKSEDEAYERLAERDRNDSTLSIDERWLVYETTENEFKNKQIPII